MKGKKTLIGILFMVGFSSLLLWSFGKQVGGYMDFSEAAQTRSRAHVVGKWVKERHFTYDREKNTFSFYMEDEKGNIRLVVYPRPKPPNFEDAEEVVVEGEMQGDVFYAEHILVKCPSKYNDMRATTAASAKE